MPVTYFRSPRTGGGGVSQTSADGRYVRRDGDQLTGSYVILGAVTASLGIALDSAGTNYIRSGASQLGALSVSNYLVSTGIIYARGNRVVSDQGTFLTLDAGPTDAANAVALKLGATSALASSNTRLVDFVNGVGTTPKAHVDKDGGAFFSGSLRTATGVNYPDGVTQTAGYPGPGGAILVFGAATVGTSNHFIPPGYGTAASGFIEVPSPYNGTINSMAVHMETNGGTCTVIAYYEQSDIGTLELASATDGSMGLGQAVTVGDRIAVRVTWTGASPDRIVVTLGITNSGVGAGV